VSVTISPPVRVLALVGVLAATGLALFFFVLGRSASEAEPRQAAVTQTRSPQTTAPSGTQTPSGGRGSATATETASGFPRPVDRALRRHGVVVVTVHMPGASVDWALLREARTGAQRADAGYVAIRGTNEGLVRTLLAKTGMLPSPAVVVVKRPGVVTSVMAAADQRVVEQAVAQARR